MSQIERVFVVASLLMPACIIDKSPTETESSGGSEAGSSGTTGTTGATGTTGSTSGSTEAPTTGSTGPAPTLCPDHPGVDACCCFEHEMSDGHGSVLPVCTATELCPPIAVECEGDLDGSCPAVADEGHLDCALQALAGAEAGQVRVAYSLTGSDGYPNRSIRVFALGDGTAFTIDITSFGEYSQYAPTGRFTLQPASFFTDCLAKTIEERTACLRQATAGAATEVCVDAFTSQDVF